jgi:hypothetical protein
MAPCAVSGNTQIAISDPVLGDQLLTMSKRFFVYILANRPRGVLYVGVTNDLIRRVGEHKAKIVPGFTKKYGVIVLVYYEGVFIDLGSTRTRSCSETLAADLEVRPDREIESGVCSAALIESQPRRWQRQCCAAPGTRGEQ